MRAAQLIRQLTEATYYSQAKRTAPRPYGGLEDITVRPSYGHVADPAAGFTYFVYLRPKWAGGWPWLREIVRVVLPPGQYGEVPTPNLFPADGDRQYMVNSDAPEGKVDLEKYPQLLAAAKRVVARGARLTPPSEIKTIGKRRDYVKATFNADNFEAAMKAIVGLKYSLASPSVLGHFVTQLEPGEIVHIWRIRVDNAGGLAKLAVAGTPPQLERAQRLYAQHAAFKDEEG